MNNIQPFEGIFDSALLNEAFTDVQITTSTNTNSANDIQSVHDRVFDSIATSNDNIDGDSINKLNINQEQYVNKEQQNKLEQQVLQRLIREQQVTEQQVPTQQVPTQQSLEQQAYEQQALEQQALEQQALEQQALEQISPEQYPVNNINDKSEIQILNNKIESLQSDVKLLYSEILKLSNKNNSQLFPKFNLCNLFKNINLKNITNNHVILGILFLLLCSILLNNDNREQFYSIRL